MSRLTISRLFRSSFVKYVVFSDSLQWPSDISICICWALWNILHAFYSPLLFFVVFVVFIFVCVGVCACVSSVWILYIYISWITSKKIRTTIVSVEVFVLCALLFSFRELFSPLSAILFDGRSLLIRGARSLLPHLFPFSLSLRFLRILS